MLPLLIPRKQYKNCFDEDTKHTYKQIDNQSIDKGMKKILPLFHKRKSVQRYSQKVRMHRCCTHKKQSDIHYQLFKNDFCHSTNTNRFLSNFSHTDTYITGIYATL